MRWRKRWARWGPAFIAGSLCVAFVISIWWIADHSVRRPLDQPADNGTYTQPQKSTTEKQPEESFWQRTTSDPVAVWTFFLVLFTAVLSGVSLRQFKYLRRADRTARIAANAAQKSAEATLGMERPFVYLEKLELVKEQVIDVYDGIRRPVVRLGFRNYGRSPAFIIRFHMDFYIGKNLPVVPVYGQGGDKTNVIEPGKIDEFQLERFDLRPSLAEMQAVVMHKAALWVYGVLIYEDFVGQEHRTGFCGLWRPQEIAGTSPVGFFRPSRSPYVFRT